MLIIAKQILAMPVSIIAVEQAFYAGRSILDQTRTSTPDSVEAQSCLDDWTKTTLRQQEIVREQNEDFMKMMTTGMEASD